MGPAVVPRQIGYLKRRFSSGRIIGMKDEKIAFRPLENRLARLRLANVETDHGNRRKELDQVYREASHSGYELIALEARKETSAPVLR